MAKAQYERILGKALIGRGPPAEHWAYSEYAWLVFEDGELEVWMSSHPILGGRKGLSVRARAWGVCVGRGGGGGIPWYRGDPCKIESSWALCVLLDLQLWLGMSRKRSGIWKRL
jgi:hypothetical protein